MQIFLSSEIPKKSTVTALDRHNDCKDSVIDQLQRTSNALGPLSTGSLVKNLSSQSVRHLTAYAKR